jgi:hypothetical protein
MKDAGAVIRATHPDIGHAHHVAYALHQQFIGNGQVAPFGKAGRPDGTCISQHQHGVGRHLEIGLVDPRRELRMVEVMVDAVPTAVLGCGDWRRLQGSDECVSLPSLANA